MAIVDNKDIIKMVTSIVQDVVDGNFDKLKAEGRLGTVDDEEDIESIQDILESYPGAISMPPAGEFHNLEKLEFPTEDDDIETYFVELYLWYSGRESDMRLKLLCKVRDKGQHQVILHDILS